MQISSQKQIQKKNKEQIKITHPTVDYLKFYLYFIYLFRQKKQIIFLYILYLFIPYPETGRIEGGKIV